MPRLANDCFANSDDMISAQEALGRIHNAVDQSVGIENCLLANCANRVLAETIYAPRNVPPADNSAVDGYAFAYSDYEKKPHQFRTVVGRSAAGAPYQGEVSETDTVKILTGAVMPKSLDSVAMIEDVQIENDKVRLPIGLKPGANCRKAGEDITKGNLLLEKGTLLRPQEVGYLASIGLSEISVFRPVTVALFSTGDELINPGSLEFEGSIFDSNRMILAAILRGFGCQVTDLGILKDELEIVRSALLKASETHDLVITSGGVSMGDEDHVKNALLKAGQLNFWRIAIKPGRPLALGHIGDAAFVGLPGNPIAAMVCCLKFVRPLVAALSGVTLAPALSFQAHAAFSIQKKPGRTEWLRARYTAGSQGIGEIEKFHTDGSGVLSSVIWANGLIELGDEVTKIDQGDLVTFLPFSELMK
ncbi:molybdopterin molybdotransferase MoeA [Sneathiella marina]|uniref:Molybdopterin molybdenumtransferase n=1 Tax=Sneathiella marina TaxID=2950108 RepID=A0ABY4W8C3_9PROT|nr:gephyrin-like molybdotransferase Glp [Sneathiella marina]USG62378.1 molybdopterin molybdotransferase MoeA [Sneathiella marina]